MHMTLGRAPDLSESKSRNRVSARAKLKVSNVFYAYFILKQKNVKYGVFYYFSAVSFNYDGLYLRDDRCESQRNFPL